MYSKILVPLDGSPTAQVMREHAGAIARCTGPRVVLLRERSRQSTFSRREGSGEDAPFVRKEVTIGLNSPV